MSKFKIKRTNFRIKVLLFGICSLLLFCYLCFGIRNSFSLAQENSKWSGVDETVVEKVAREHGRSAWTPFINTDQGDLLLFVFLVAGAAGGFIMGYNFRKLFFKK